MSFGGYAVTAILVMFFAFLLPSVIRSRQVVLDSRVEDRFSEDLRVVARAGDPPEPKAERSNRGYVHPRIEQPEAPMHTPVARGDRLAAADARRAAASRAARAAAASRRAAAARRRLALTLLLLGATAVTWTLFAVASLPVAAAIVPSVLLLAVVVAGRRASARAAVADARWRAEVARDTRDPFAPVGTIDRAEAPVRHSKGTRRDGAAERPGTGSTTPGPERTERTERTERRARPAAATGTRPSLRIDVDPASLLPEEPVAHRAGPELPEGEGWTPVPVPAPTYTLKPAVRRREVAPFETDEQTTAASATDEADTEVPAPSETSLDATAEATEHDPADAPAEPAAPAMNLQAVLARRRASGQ
ncbi:hypothetical protein EXU48_11640 [Occultella glacieicola]|uniref:Uncharacterized protein n=1 Tax=Occultella glacieicola TaxID=2518684 RepID=A0ABY2E385_9MICO|nr:hypothetical protein [Occultella glacieicola]TDE94093.1 hypothetical protein EXU48_11640 [Occultella glacieicola]